MEGDFEMMKLYEQIKKYTPANEQEQNDKEQMLAFMQANDNCLTRENTVAHFTTSIWTVNKERTKTLMVYHNIYNSWSWIGGHADGEENLAEVAAVIYNSLAKCYGKTIAEIEEITGKQFEGIHIVGGGANAEYLNQLTAKATGKTVYAGPTEATAIGNLSAQMIAGKELQNLNDARNCIFESFEIKIYE